jgi:hypothetical protein
MSALRSSVSLPDGADRQDTAPPFTGHPSFSIFGGGGQFIAVRNLHFYIRVRLLYGPH